MDAFREAAKIRPKAADHWLAKLGEIDAEIFKAILAEIQIRKFHSLPEILHLGCWKLMPKGFLKPDLRFNEYYESTVYRMAGCENSPLDAGGRLTRENGVYRFVYTRGAEAMADFRPFGRMLDLHKAYKSEELFPIFANRILAKNRPEYQDYLGWLGLSEDQYDALEELARTAGLRATDSLELFPCPEPTEGKNYEVYFFCRGLRHLHSENQERARLLSPGERLYLMKDLQNPHDSMALLMRTSDPITLVGCASLLFGRIHTTDQELKTSIR